MLGLLMTKTCARPLLVFLRPLMLDAEKVVQQGLGWFLRETWKKQAKPVEAFLIEWKDRAPRVIFQYATEKMTPDARACFRRARK
jgi:3-methyladenine DNA glycosylase AlkD